MTEELRLMQADRANPEYASEVAAFWMEGEVLHSRYSDPEWEAELEGRGIFVASAGEVLPDQGQAFFDFLPLAFSNSSMVWVEYHLT